MGEASTKAAAVHTPWSTVLDGGPVAEFGLAESGIIHHANRRGAELLGSSCDRLIGSSILSRVAADERGRFRDRLRTCRGSARPQDAIFHVAQRTVQMTSVAGAPPLPGDVRSVMVPLQELRDDILAVAAHELKTPLTSLQLTVQMLLGQVRRSADAEQAAGQPLDLGPVIRQLALMERQIGHMKRLTANLLDLTQLARHDVTLRRARVPLGALLGDVLTMCATVHPETAIHLDERAADVAVDADRDRLEEVFTNLVDNAVKHGRGAVTVSLTVAATEAYGGEAIVAVTDCGPGVPDREQERIFDAFVRAGARDAEGLGLGLYLCKEIVAAHGGRIWLTNAPGAGAMFSVALPLWRGDVNPANSADSSGDEGEP